MCKKKITRKPYRYLFFLPSIQTLSTPSRQSIIIVRLSLKKNSATQWITHCYLLICVFGILFTFFFSLVEILWQCQTRAAHTIPSQMTCIYTIYNYTYIYISTTEAFRQDFCLKYDFPSKKHTCIIRAPDYYYAIVNKWYIYYLPRIPRHTIILSNGLFFKTNKKKSTINHLKTNILLYIDFVTHLETIFFKWEVGELNFVIHTFWAFQRHTQRTTVF